ncbi:thioredoxin-like protein [Mobilisporobacter senegalensis]|uniref:Thioredoxin-like protein n=1 Tax=Mobilisporobacter senegalensis TaxID=1329262 RepID=A0A3N1XI08_9FIRM|nr:(2Fe-2S) ferredoxin domain-containing protein [Mobilisporobacter senegalensis]ROR26376.1 thioredoxin-like protein [Mobilisporobacter senegalensis]
MTITICIGSSCHLKGSREVIRNLEELVERNGLQNKVEMEGSFCLNQCVKGVCVKIEDQIYSVTPSTTEEFFKNEVLTRVK